MSLKFIVFHSHFNMEYLVDFKISPELGTGNEVGEIIFRSNKHEVCGLVGIISPDRVYSSEDSGAHLFSSHPAPRNCMVTPTRYSIV